MTEEYVRAVQDMCYQSKTAVRTPVGVTESFEVEVGSPSRFGTQSFPLYHDPGQIDGEHQAGIALEHAVCRRHRAVLQN